MTLLRYGLEVLFLLALLYFIFIRAKAFNFLKPLGRLKLAAFMLFIGLWTFVQVVDRWQYQFPDKKIEFFPIARFAMFQSGYRTRYIFVHDFFSENNGRRTDYVLADLLRGAGVETLSTKMNSVVIPALQSADEKEKNWAKKEVQKYIRSIYNVLQYQQKRLPDSISFAIITIDMQKNSSNAITRNTILNLANPFLR
ncbi:hypothetical protein [Mucilaginibacter sp. HD30]